MRAILRADRGGGFPILYVPGIDGTGQLLLGTEQRLEEQYRLVRIAYRGDDAPACDTYEELARSIAQVCREQQVERCLVLAESFGGAVGLQLALDFPELVKCVLLVNTFVFYPRPLRLFFSRKISPWVPRVLFDLGRRTLATRGLFGRNADSEALRAFHELPGAFFDQAYQRRMQMIAGLDLRERLESLSQPVMLVASDQDRVVPSTLSMAVIAKLIPQATLETVKGGGHMILPLAGEPWPERVAQLLARFRISTRETPG